MQCVNIDKDEIRFLANFQGSDLICHVNGFGTDAGSHGKSLLCGDHGGIAGWPFGKEGRQAHFLEKVEIIVGGCAIRADTNLQSKF